MLMLCAPSSASAVFAVQDVYVETAHFGVPLSILHPANPNTLITGSLSVGNEGGSLAFWITSPVNETILAHVWTWSGEREVFRFEFAAPEGGVYTFHVENQLRTPTGCQITLILNSRLDWNRIMLPWLFMVAAVIGGVAIGWLLWSIRKLRRKPSDKAPPPSRRKLVRATHRAS
jgi:heme/copper-type cytochrome/quinol oxidase subunit 2